MTEEITEDENVMILDGLIGAIDEVILRITDEKLKNRLKCFVLGAAKTILIQFVADSENLFIKKF